MLLPIYDQVAGNGANGQYHILGFAALYLTGYKFNGNNKSPSTHDLPSGTPGNSGTCIQGYFTGFTTTGTIVRRTRHGRHHLQARRIGDRE